MEWTNVISSRKIWAAKKSLSTFITKTPLIRSNLLSQFTGKNIFLKLETVHPIGAFKLRGAANKILSLTAEERERGVTTFSTGNHGLAVAYVARELGIKAVVCVSNRVPDAKIDALKRMGAELEIVGNSQDEAGEYCSSLRDQYGMTIIPPFDDPEVIAGQGTIGLEILEDVPEIDHCIVPLSGGGLLAGIGLALKRTDPAIRISGVSIEGASAMYESLKQNKPTDVEEKETLADSLLGGIGIDNQYTLPIVREVMDDITLLEEDSIGKGMMYLYKKERQIVEGAAAVGVGAILDGKFDVLGENVVIIISGNNVNPSIFETLSIYEIDQIKGACL